MLQTLEKKDEAEANEAKRSPVISEKVSEAKLTRAIKFDVVDKRHVSFTRDVAEKFINMDTFVGERNLRNGHVEFLVKHAKEGTFLIDQCVLATCICKYDNTERRLNGQHTAWMRTYMPDNWQPKICIVRYAANSEDDFRRLYSLMDRGAPRTKSNILVARIFGASEFLNFSVSQIGQIGSGFALFYGVPTGGRQKGHGPNTSKLKSDKIADLLSNEFYSTACRIRNMIDNLNKDQKKIMIKAPVVAAMFATFAKSIEMSNEFWDAVKTGVGFLGTNDPRNRLRTLLMTTTLYGGVKSVKSMNSGDMYNISICCWNAYRAGKDLSALRFPDSRPAAK